VVDGGGGDGNIWPTMPLIKLKERRVLSSRAAAMAMVLHCTYKSRMVGQLYQLRYTSREGKRGETSGNVLSQNSRSFHSIRTRETRPGLFCCCKNRQNRRNEIFRSDCTLQEQDSVLPSRCRSPLFPWFPLLAPFASNPRPQYCLMLLIDSRRFNRYLITSQSGRSV